MKIVIDIPEEVKEVFDKANEDNLKGSYYDYNSLIGKAIQNGTPLSNNVTNGDVIKALFPNVHCNETCNETLVWTDLDSESTRFLKSWWNAPYRGR